jgi:hydrogenase maturation protein HypF
MCESNSETATERARVAISGAVQGVGFRPLVYRLATELGLGGWVLNSSQGVQIEVEGERGRVRQFLHRVENERPPLSVIRKLEYSFLDPVGSPVFEIRSSGEHGAKTALIQPDSATCADCVREIFDPANRRYRYPFNNCTNCGPRFTIVESMPFDRVNTSMKGFAMCPECAREYGDPLDRRFDAQAIACSRCGPQLELWDRRGGALARCDDALLQTAVMLREGRIIALKGLGGFQLLVDARDEPAVARLRARKRREEKPFAVMYPTLDMVRRDCEVSGLEERLLLSPQSPIVLLRRKGGLASSVAPRNPWLGVMLPYTPLHHLLMAELGFPVVATSGNLSDEPICTDEHDALERLRGICDAWLVHNRPIVRHMDDSIVRVVCGREMVLRRARGYAPLPIHVRAPLPAILAVGGHLKNNVALSIGPEVFISQHLGDLTTPQAHTGFLAAAADLPRLYDVTPEAVASDLHPDYLSTRYAADFPAPRYAVQHHWAHVLACMAENELDGPVLGVSWDGTGLGPDGTVWGGEFLTCGDDAGSFTRAAHLRTFRLAGGESAIRQPARVALGLLFEIWGPRALGRSDLAPVRSLARKDLALIEQILAKGIHAPVTSSAGRLFDAIASLLDLRQRLTFEGQTAMELEFAIQPGIEDFYPFNLRDGAPRVVDWQPMVERIISDMERGDAAGVIAARFHNTLAEIIVAVAHAMAERNVVLTGGCFQNHYLTERTVARLVAGSFTPYWHRHIPPNDGGIALGQIMGAARVADGVRAEWIAAPIRK